MFQGSAYRDKEYRLVTKDGAIKWISAAWGPIFDEMRTANRCPAQRKRHFLSEARRGAFRESERRFRDSWKAFSSSH